MEITFIENTIKLNDKELFKVPYKIKDVLKFNKVIVILSEYSEKEVLNIFGYDYSGNIMWQIDKKLENFNNIPTPYTGIYLQDDVLTAYNSAGYELQIDYNTGKVLNIDFIK
ncbi:hypothetical protein AT05_11840 [Schleiferia thermophila str. Yellowstone]|uniref:hypothetical protein n=1 Tax=Schleiferia thermophila TaxID=884107 RepID=UPI0004E7146C|nr:hypothetical protein [Schleiferia thermophila]KFD38105.1 hypothetical protein AT05_11840 [Schleiferia thermophila str. Yellowstone]